MRAYIYASGSRSLYAWRGADPIMHCKDAALHFLLEWISCQCPWPSNRARSPVNMSPASLVTSLANRSDEQIPNAAPIRELVWCFWIARHAAVRHLKRRLADRCGLEVAKRKGYKSSIYEMRGNRAMTVRDLVCRTIRVMGILACRFLGNVKGSLARWRSRSAPKMVYTCAGDGHQPVWCPTPI